MIEDLRWVIVKTGQGDEVARILQAYDGYVWFDIPAVDLNDKV